METKTIAQGTEKEMNLLFNNPNKLNVRSCEKNGELNEWIMTIRHTEDIAFRNRLNNCITIKELLALNEGN